MCRTGPRPILSRQEGQGMEGRQWQISWTMNVGMIDEFRESFLKLGPGALKMQMVRMCA